MVGSIISQLAQSDKPKVNIGDIGYDGFTGTSNDALTSLFNIVYGWAAIVCVITLIVAGYLYITARGNAESMKRAKDATRAAVIGLVVVIMAFAITGFVLGRFS